MSKHNLLFILTLKINYFLVVKLLFVVKIKATYTTIVRETHSQSSFRSLCVILYSFDISFEFDLFFLF